MASGDPSDKTDTVAESDSATDSIAAQDETSYLSAQDKRVIAELFQASPQLFQQFKLIIDFVDLLERDPKNYPQLFTYLQKIEEIFKLSYADVVQLSRFAAAAGFAVEAVKFLRQIMKEVGLVYYTSFSEPYLDHRTGCAGILTSMFMDLTHFSGDFCLRFAKTGVLEDMMTGLIHSQHFSGDELESGSVCFFSIGTILNCCKLPEVVPIVKRLDIVPYMTPFLTKQSFNIRLGALLLLAFIVDADQLVLLEMDHSQLQYMLTCSQTAVTSLNPDKNDWEVEELVEGWSLLARLDFNRGLMVAKEGVVELLKTVLQSGTEREKEVAAATFLQLATDAANAKLCQRNRGLMELLSAIQHTEHRKIQEAVSNTLRKLREADREEDDMEENTALYDVLADQMNTLAILGMGKVEFLLGQLTDITSGGSSARGDVTCVQIVTALIEMTTDDSCQREILARGGLGLIQNVLHSDGDDGKMESLKLLLELASCKEHCVVIQGQTELMRIVQSLTLQDNEELRHTATHVTNTVGRHVT